MPPQVPFIIGNEACERFSFYGMRNILTIFLIDWLLKNHVPAQAEREAAAKAAFHLFVFGVYFTPLLGGFLADRFLGKYRTILYISLLYCAGHACLAIFHDDRNGFYAGLVLIALGSGGIKPCVSALVGDQFTAENKQLVNKVFAMFYWSINLGSFFASMLIPKTLRLFGPAVAFGIPGILMGIATLVFWMGRGLYVRVPPSGRDPHSFTAVLASAWRNRRQGGSLLRHRRTPQRSRGGGREDLRSVAGRALRRADGRGDPGLGDRPGVRVHPGATEDEERDPEFLEPHDGGGEPGRGARFCARLLQRDRAVLLLRRLRLPGSSRPRSRGAPLQGGRVVPACSRARARAARAHPCRAGMMRQRGSRQP